MPKKDGRRLSGFRPEAVAEFNEANDDEAEVMAMAELKREEAEKRAQASSPFRETPGHQRRAKLLDSYADCIKMCTENVRGGGAPHAALALPLTPPLGARGAESDGEELVAARSDR